MTRFAALILIFAATVYGQTFGSANANRLRGRNVDPTAPTNLQTLLWKCAIPSPVFTGAGLNDASSGGTCTANTASLYEIVIDSSVASPDTFKWRKDGGSWTANVAMTGAAQTIADGVTITFKATDGHTLTDAWAIQTTVSWTPSAAGVGGADAVTGASALTEVNTIPKVGSAGVLAESALKDDGTNITTTATRTYGFGTFARTGNTAPGAGNVVWWGNPKLVVADPATLGAESLTNGALLTPGAEWAVAGDFALAANAATFTWASGAGTLTQPTASQAITPGSAAQWYKFVYTVSGVTATSPACSITSAFGDTTFGLALDMTAGAGKALYFKSAAAPANFVISCTAASGAFTLDDLSLKNIQGGDLALSGNLTARGATFNGGSGSTMVVIQAGKAQSTTDLFQVKNAAGATLANITNLGYLYFAGVGGIGSSLTTSGYGFNYYTTGLTMGASFPLLWAASTQNVGFDLSLLRKTSTPGVLRVGDGSTGYGSIEANNITAVALATPATPVITQGGTGGATPYGYKIACLAGDGTTTAASVEGTTATGNATLSATDYNIVTFTPSTGKTTCDVFRTTGGATQGKIGNTTASVFNDTGLAASGAAPAANGTGTVTAAKVAAGPITGTTGVFTSTLSAVPGATVPACAKYTIPYTNAAFLAAASSVDVTLFSLPALGKLTGVTVKHSTAFAGTGVTSTTVSVGDAATPYNQYASAFDIFQATGDTVFQDSSQFKSTTMAASTVSARFTANTNFGNGAATVLTAGSVDVRACWVVLP